MAGYMDNYRKLVIAQVPLDHNPPEGVSLGKLGT